MSFYSVSYWSCSVPHFECHVHDHDLQSVSLVLVTLSSDLCIPPLPRHPLWQSNRNLTPNISGAELLIPPPVFRKSASKTQRHLRLVSTSFVLSESPADSTFKTHPASDHLPSPPHSKAPSALAWTDTVAPTLSLVLTLALSLCITHIPLFNNPPVAAHCS